MKYWKIFGFEYGGAPVMSTRETPSLFLRMLGTTGTWPSPKTGCPSPVNRYL